MPTRMSPLINKYWKGLATLTFGVGVFLLWWLVYPALTAYHEQYQLFLMDSGYIGQLLTVPDGLARCIGEYLVQTYINHALAALVLAVALVLLQWLTWRLMVIVSTKRPDTHYALSFLPSMFLCLLLGDESVLLTFVVALLLTEMSMWIYEKVPGRWQILYLIMAIPVVYWLAGPAVLMLATYTALRMWQVKAPKMSAAGLGLLTIVYAVVCIIVSSHLVPYPLTRLFRGLDYYRFTEVYFVWLSLLMAVCVLIPIVTKWLPTALKPQQQLITGLGEAVILAAIFLLLRPLCFDARKYELMEYDYLVRSSNWSAIINKAERKMPDLPMSVCATNLALGMKGQLGDRAFEFYQNGLQGLLPEFERNFSTMMLASEIYWHLGMVNTAQRLAFETMEAIPNYAKSCRCIKRLAESNLVNGQYEVARKYLKMLEKTISYKKWAQRTLLMLGNEQAIDTHPVYGKMRQLRLKDDFLFSEKELDKMMGQLLMQNTKNGLALQYLLLCPLLQRDINTFMNYMTFVDGLKLGYRPRMCQEAVAFAFAQRNQQPPQGYVNQMVANNFRDFIQTYNSGGASATGLERFKQTTWYYLMVGK